MTTLIKIENFDISQNDADLAAPCPQINLTPNSQSAFIGVDSTGKFWVNGAVVSGGGGASSWDTLQSALANLTLNNAGFTTTFNQTSAVAWAWANTTAATASVAQSSPSLVLAGQYWNGAASAVDQWVIQNIIANGTNGISTLAITHSGSTGAAQVLHPDGTATRPGISFSSHTNGGLCYNGTTMVLNAATGLLSVTDGNAGGLGFGSGSLTITGPRNLASNSLNNASVVSGQSSELLTLSTVGTTTDTVGNLLPANAIIDAVVARVTTTITVATDWSLGDATTPTRFANANTGVAAGSTGVGLNAMQGGIATNAAGPVQLTAAPVRVTTTGTPGAGVIRITVFWRQFIAPTS